MTKQSSYGVTTTPPQGYLQIAIGHPGAERLFKGTKWEKDWPQILLKLKGARRGVAVIDGTIYNSVNIPLSYVIDDFMEDRR